MRRTPDLQTRPKNKTKPNQKKINNEKTAITCYERGKPIDDFSSRAPLERRRRPQGSKEEIGNEIRHVPEAPLLPDHGQIRSAVRSLQVVMHLAPPFLVRDQNLLPRHKRPRFHGSFRLLQHRQNPNPKNTRERRRDGTKGGRARWERCERRQR